MARRRKRNPPISRSGVAELGAWLAAIGTYALLPQPIGARVGGAALAGAGAYSLVRGEQSKWIGAIFVGWGVVAFITPEILTGMRGGLPAHMEA